MYNNANNLDYTLLMTKRVFGMARFRGAMTKRLRLLCFLLEKQLLQENIWQGSFGETGAREEPWAPKKSLLSLQRQIKGLNIDQSSLTSLING